MRDLSEPKGLIKPGVELVHVVALLAVCGALYFGSLGRVPFFNKGEAREALVVRDIVLHGNWLFPLRDGRQIPSKPPLFHWTGAVVSKIWGELSETTVRFPSALFAVSGVMLLYGFGRQLYDSQTGFVAALILATTLAFVTEGGEARVDMTLTFFLTLTLCLFYALHKAILTSPVWNYVFYLTSGVAVLAKGPVSLVVSGLVIGMFLAVKKRWTSLLRVAFHPGALLGIGVFVFWYGAAIWRGGEEFFGLQLVAENFERFFVHGEGGTGHQKPVYYFIPYVFALGMPWTLFLPFALFDAFKEKYFSDERALFLGLWIAVVFVFFSLSAGKRSIYILPLYPALALFTAVWFERQRQRITILGVRRTVTGVVALVVGLVIFVPLAGVITGNGVFWFGPYIRSWMKPNDWEKFIVVEQAFIEAGWLLPISLAASGLLWCAAGWSLFANQLRGTVGALAGASVLGAIVAHGVVLPALAGAQSYKSFVLKVNDQFRGSGPLYIFKKGLDPSAIVFYGGQHVQVLDEDYDSLLRRLADSGDSIIVGERQWNELTARYSTPGVVELRGRGSGPDGDNRLVLIRGIGSDKERVP